MTKPIVARTPENGAEYGFETVEDARRVFPEAEIVRYQDGTPYEAEGGTGESAGPNLKAMKRADLETYAASVGIENAADKDAFPNIDTLREAVETRMAGTEAPGVEDETVTSPEGEEAASGTDEAESGTDESAGA
jgi:hypothetical protein